MLMAASSALRSANVNSDRRIRRMVCVLCVAALTGLGCTDDGGRGEGPGHRAQVLALDPQRELQLGRQAYREILSNPSKYGEVLPNDAPETQRVHDVARRIIAAAGIEPLQREINLHPSRFEWEIHVLDNPQINAFCLPGGKMAVFTGLLRVVENDDQLATVISHETAHALAHHVSERIAHQNSGQGALAMLRGKAFDRDQEAEADHIGVFLMPFAGYNPDEAVHLWQRMEQISARQPQLPPILSDHPSNAQRMRNMAGWVPRAKAAKKKYDEGKIEAAAKTNHRMDREVLWARVGRVSSFDTSIAAFLQRRPQ
jgi:metalloendopeptidase OMA1, mitochondrial